MFTKYYPLVDLGENLWSSTSPRFKQACLGCSGTFSDRQLAGYCSAYERLRSTAALPGRAGGGGLCAAGAIQQGSLLAYGAAGGG